uniref:DUF3615 domain-containing protein n=1 Tax=Leersia perrieri TaxID=77586 RepID=A0A0D9WMD9_9ORYZ
MGSVLARARVSVLSLVVNHAFESSSSSSSSPAWSSLVLRLVLPLAKALPFQEQDQISRRLFRHLDRNSDPHLEFIRRPRSAEESNALDASQHVDHVVRHYNSSSSNGSSSDNHQLIDVKPLLASGVVYRGDVWFHVNFLARRRKETSTPPRRFFAELRYAGAGDGETPIVESCTLLGEDDGGGGDHCVFCSLRCGDMMIHPAGDSFSCGKKGQEEELALLGIYKTCNFHE